jgi:decaprenylphospho-beta-D-ribofuranose 2-oxidase
MAHDISDIAHAEEDLGCYSGLYSSHALVYAPETEDELRRIFAYAKQAKRRITFRAGGHCFDQQALNDDIVVSMARFDGIDLDVENRRLTVGPGATWGAILARCERHGLVPAITVTTAHATAGGTLSGDCLSRFSPAYGKEGQWILAFDVLTVEGERITCTRPPKDKPYADMTRSERVFCGVIGGLGYLGAVLSITYELLYVCGAPGRIGVHTVVRKFRSFEKLAKDLVPAAKKTYEEQSDPCDRSKYDGIFSVLFAPPEGDPYLLLFKSTFTPSTDRKRMALHQPGSAIRPFVEWAMRSERFARLAWPFYWNTVYGEGEEFIDDLAGFTFFMDGNVRAKHIAANMGFKLKTVQQTFIVPSAPGAEGGWDKAKDDLVEWLEYATSYLRARDLQPTLHDILFLPQDARFLLSASAGLAGFAVSYAFETSDEDTIARVKRAFSELANVLWEKFRGRVYLVKNVCAEPETLEAMYQANAPDFFALKKELDPGLVLRNAFLERTFPNLLRWSAP